MYYLRLIKQSDYVDFDPFIEEDSDSYRDYNTYTQSIIDALKVDNADYLVSIANRGPDYTDLSDYTDVFVKPFNMTIKDAIKEGIEFDSDPSWQQLSTYL